MVQVTTNAGNVTGEVSLLNAQDQPISTTTLPASSVQIAGEQVSVTVPESMLPSTAPPSTHPETDHDSFTFSTSLPGNSESDVAGFASEYTMITVDGSSDRR